MTGTATNFPRGLLALSFVSGALALSYEVLWARHLLNLFGSTTTATATTLAAFMAGMALGAWLMGRRAAALGATLLVYAGIEFALALYGLAVGPLTALAADIVPAGLSPGVDGFGATLAVRALGNLLILVPPAALIGATLPLLASALQRFGGGEPRYLAKLYGINTFGAAAGAALTGFWGLPALGLSVAQAAATATALVLALVAVVLAQYGPKSAPRIAAANGPISSERRQARPKMLGLALLLAGSAALGYEMVWTRVLVLVMGSSTYAFTLMLCAYLLGLALGGLWIGRYLDRLASPAVTWQHLQLAIALAASLGIALFPYLPLAVLAGFARFGVSAWAVTAVNALVALTMVLAPAFLIGAALPVAARLTQGRRPDRGRELGTALAWVSAGHVVGIMVTAFAVIPVVGLQDGILTLAGVSAAAGILLYLASPRRRAPGARVLPLGVIVLAFVGWALPRWDINIMTSGVYQQAAAYLNLLGSWRGFERAFSQYRPLYYREGREAVVSVVKRPSLSGRPHIMLAINGKVDASTGADMATQILSGHLPLLFRPGARDALVIGLASGVTVGSLGRHALRRIDVVEIEKAVVDASRSFEAVNGSPLKDPRVRVIIEDGRQYLGTTDKSYDIIVSEPSNPWLSASARLFTKEFFALVRKRLSPRGVFVQWVPLYGLSEEHFKALLDTLASAFADVAVFRVGEGDLVAVAGAGGLNLAPRTVTALYRQQRVRGDLNRAGITSAEDLVALWVADKRGLAATLGHVRQNTDDNGLIEFGSPWYILRDTKSKNSAILKQASAASDFARRLAKDWMARGEPGLVRSLARRHIASRRYDLAAILARELRDRGDRAGDILLGDIAAKRKDWPTAIAHWSRAKAPAAKARLAEAAFRRGDLDRALALYREVASGDRRAADSLLYGLLLTMKGEHNRARSVLAEIGPGRDNAPRLLAPLVRAYVAERRGDKRADALARRAFDDNLAWLRGRLEVDTGRALLDDLVLWEQTWRHRLPPRLRAQLQNRMYRHITRPLPAYYRAVRHFWLGQYDEAAAGFETYLGMLPDGGATAKARALLAESRKRSRKRRSERN